eukprot:scaffold30486_cov63-Phaeocystis_antarctica.AAC.3
MAAARDRLRVSISLRARSGHSRSLRRQASSRQSALVRRRGPIQHVGSKGLVAACTVSEVDPAGGRHQRWPQDVAPEGHLPAAEA